MSLREDMWKYEQITGESAEHVPIIKLGAFLDGYEKGWEEGRKALEQTDILDKIEEEINSPNRGTCDYFIVDRIEEIINKYKVESDKESE